MQRPNIPFYLDQFKLNDNPHLTPIRPVAAARGVFVGYLLPVASHR